MDYHFEFRPYRRLFKQPLRTRYGFWNVREGLILRLTDAEGRIGWGEVAPIADFGTESFAQALSFCQFLATEISEGTIAQIPATFPACQFGFGAALENLSVVPSGNAQTALNSLWTVHEQSYLLPTGRDALRGWQDPWQQGFRTFKWKIGVVDSAEELRHFETLMQCLPEKACLRLDANGGLNWDTASRWLATCDRLTSSYAAKVEFLEQPLPIEQFDQLLNLHQQFRTPIALDESVSTLTQIQSCYQKGWRGIFVIKAALAGSPEKLRSFCQTHAIEVVWSSALETSVAQHFIRHRLIPAVPASDRAVGFGVDHWFLDTTLNQLDFEQLWQSL
ncbi:o-succinylbenzoate synthase [Egbenema bharatensis]|uniref:o-succinylbenzoate synthase n=1 Tax=Egbenema bharatensis TaxID=3463334 RepID=UPI003A847EB3